MTPADKPPTQLSLPHPPVVIAIAGCSGSGKTTLARELRAELPSTLLPLDLYYRDLSHLQPEERARQNFDHPDSLEYSLLLDHLKRLVAGESVDAPIYDFATHTRLPGQSIRLDAKDFVLIEGILALHFDALRPLYNLAVYVNAPHELCLRRRIHRDVRDRGRTEASVREQFWATAHPMAERFVLPSAVYADITVEGTDSLDWSIEQVLSRLRRDGLF